HLNEGARPTLDAVDRVRAHGLHRHDVGHGDLVGRAPGSDVEFFLVADDTIDFRHGDEITGLGLSSTAGHDNDPVRPLALEAADCLPRLPYCFCGNSTGIDDDRVLNTGCSSLATNCLGLVGVKPAAKCDDIDAHDTLALVKSAGSKRPSNSNCTGPV